MNIQEIKKEIERKNPDVFLLVKRDIGHQVGMVLEEARAIKGFTQKELAEKIGTQQPSIARIENGSQIPSLSFLGKIANVFDTYLIPPRFAFMDEPRHTMSFIIEAKSTPTNVVGTYRIDAFKDGYVPSRQEFPSILATSGVATQFLVTN